MPVYSVPGRFIPAYAGNSQIGITKTGFPTVHPRLRGELMPVVEEDNLTNGSSPLTRGTRSTRVMRVCA